MKLNGADKRILRAMGNRLKPIIHIGKEGLTEEVLGAVDEAHLHTELLKVKILDTCPIHRREVAAEFERRSGSELVQLLGRTILLYRRHPDAPEISLPSYPLQSKE